MRKIKIFLGVFFILDSFLFAEYKLSNNVIIIDNKNFDITQEGIFIFLYENGKIIRAVKENNELLIRNASMEEAFEELDINYKYNIKPKDIKYENYLLKGVSLEKNENKFKLIFNNFELIDYDSDYNTSDDKILLNGYLEFSIDGNWKIEIEKNSLKRLDFSNSFEQKGNFDVIFSTPIRIPLPFSKEFVIAEYEFNPVVVGPVVFTPVVSIVVGFNVGIAGSVKVNLKNSMKGFYNISYRGGRWYSDGNLDKKEQNGYLSFVGADGWINGYIGPKLKIKFYDVVGPYVEGFGFIKANAETESVKPLSFKWRLYGGFDLNAGVSVKIFSFGIKDFEKNIYKYEKEIVSGSYPKKNSVDNLELDFGDLILNSDILNLKSISVINSGRW